jgi:hypothetical protein
MTKKTPPFSGRPMKIIKSSHVRHKQGCKKFQDLATMIEDKKCIASKINGSLGCMHVEILEVKLASYKLLHNKDFLIKFKFYCKIPSTQSRLQYTPTGIEPVTNR